MEPNKSPQRMVAVPMFINHPVPVGHPSKGGEFVKATPVLPIPTLHPFTGLAKKLFLEEDNSELLKECTISAK